MLVPRGKAMGDQRDQRSGRLARHAGRLCAWAAWGNDEWSYSQVLPYFRKLETALDRHDSMALAYLTRTHHWPNLTIRANIRALRQLFDGTRVADVVVESGRERFTLEPSEDSSNAPFGLLH
jgi:choline dehydrogenase-like flavoprotein